MWRASSGGGLRSEVWLWSVGLRLREGLNGGVVVMSGL